MPGTATKSRITSGGAAVLLLLLQLGCTGEPPVAGFDHPDRAVAEHLMRLHAAATERASNAAARGRLAIAYDINGFADAARVVYAQAEALDGDEFRWPYYLALLTAAEGDPQDALAPLERAQDIDASYQPAWLWRGKYLIELGRNADAAAVYEQALALERSPPAIVGLARTHLRLEDPVAAAALLEPLAQEFRHPYVFRLLGQALRALGREDEAEVALLMGHAATPLGWYDALELARWEEVRGLAGSLTHAELLLASGRIDEAIERLEALRKAAPDHDVLLNNLSTAYARAGRDDDSDEVLRHALRRHPNSFAFHLNYATRLLRKGHLDLALSYADKALALSPDLSAGHELRGMILNAKRDEAGASEAFRRAQSPKGYYSLAMYEGARSNWPAAIELLRKSARLDPADAKTLVFLGRSHAEAGDFDEALQALRKARMIGTHPNEVASALARLNELKRWQRPIRVLDD